MIRHLAGSLLAALFLSGTGYALHAWAQHRLDQQRQQHGKLVAEARQTRERLQRTQQDEPAVRLAIQQFDTLRAQGVIGPEHRLEWIDQLREIERSLRLPKSDFSLQPQRQLAAIPGAAPYAIYSSRAPARSRPPPAYRSSAGYSQRRRARVRLQPDRQCATCRRAGQAGHALPVRLAEHCPGHRA